MKEKDGMGMETKYTTEEQIEEMRKAILSERQKLSMGGRAGPGMRKRALKTVGRVLFIFVVLVLVITIVSVSIARNQGEVPDILGFHLFVVESGSMEPTFHIGTVILCRKPKDPGALKINDIVTFQNLSGYIVTHRIVEVMKEDKKNTVYRTKGDNPMNSTDLEPLTPDRVLSVFVVKIPLT